MSPLTPSRPDLQPPPDSDGGADADRRRDRARQQRRIDDVFGDVLPLTTEDERDPTDQHGFSAQHYLGNTPPHHGG